MLSVIVRDRVKVIIKVKVKVKVRIRIKYRGRLRRSVQGDAMVRVTEIVTIRFRFCLTQTKNLTPNITLTLT